METLDILSEHGSKDDTYTPAEQTKEVKTTEVESVKKIKNLKRKKRKNEADNLVDSLTETFETLSEQCNKDYVSTPSEQPEEVKAAEVESIKKNKHVGRKKRKNEADNLVDSLTKTFDISSEEKRKNGTSSSAEQSEEVKAAEIESIKKI